MRGVIQSIGFHQSRRPSRAGGVCRMWTGAKPDENKSGPGDIRQDTTRTADSNTQN